MIREAVRGDLEGLLALYAQLHNEPAEQPGEAARQVWETILQDENYTVVVAEEAGRVVSTCICTVVWNLTHQQRPYAVIENVVTDRAFRGRGLATGCLNYARGVARRRNCYKMMLMTGSRQESTLRFYERAGYTRHDKTAFIQWL